MSIRQHATEKLFDDEDLSDAGMYASIENDCFKEFWGSCKEDGEDAMIERDDGCGYDPVREASDTERCRLAAEEAVESGAFASNEEAAEYYKDMADAMLVSRSA